MLKTFTKEDLINIPSRMLKPHLRCAVLFFKNNPDFKYVEIFEGRGGVSLGFKDTKGNVILKGSFVESYNIFGVINACTLVYTPAT